MYFMCHFVISEMEEDDNIYFDGYKNIIIGLRYTIIVKAHHGSVTKDISILRHGITKFVSSFAHTSQA